MRVAPEIINTKWMDTLADADLLDVEARLHEQLAVIERREKKAKGEKYSLYRGPADLMLAWDRWSRVNAAALGRSLRPRHA